jgi:hypothetical protein
MFAKQTNWAILSEQYFVNMGPILNTYGATFGTRGNAKKKSPIE